MRVLLTVALATVLIALGSVGSALAVDQAECVQLVKLATADFRGTGRLDVVLGLPRQPGPPGVYRSIIVRSPAGATLLDITSPTMYWSVFIANVAGAPRPLLMTGTPDGNWLRVEAWMYASPEVGFERLKWDGADYAHGREPHVDPATQQIRMVTERGATSYRFAQGELRATR